MTHEPAVGDTYCIGEDGDLHYTGANGHGWTVERKILALLFVIITVASVAVYQLADNSATDSVQQAEAVAARQANTNYANALTACVQTNPLRESVALAIETAALTTTNPEAREKYREALTNQLTQPFIRSDGSKECLFAVAKP